MVHSWFSRSLCLLVLSGWLGCSNSTESPGDSLEASPGPVAVVASFAPGQMLESVAISHSGEVHVTQLRADGRCDIVVIDASGGKRALATLPALGGLAFDGEGALHATSGGNGQPGQVWRVSPTGALTVEADLAQGAWPNGLTAAGDGALYVADSALGIVWRLAPGAPPEAWATSEALQPKSPPVLPGANGLKWSGGALYVSNSDRGQILRIRRQDDGSAGPAETVVTGVAVDDFAFDERGSIYATTHLFNSVLRLDPDGAQTTIADAATGAVGPSAAVFGRGAGDTTSLYVVTDGNFFGGTFAKNGQPVIAPVLLRIAVGVPGAPLP